MSDPAASRGQGRRILTSRPCCERCKSLGKYAFTLAGPGQRGESHLYIRYNRAIRRNHAPKPFMADLPHAFVAPSHWRPRHRIRWGELPPRLQPWVLDSGSLTRKLRQACGEHFGVHLLAEARERPRPDEASALGVSPRQLAFVREVVLRCADAPWVFARTVVPLQTLAGPNRRLLHLGTRPLGELLFADPKLDRGPMEVTATRPGPLLSEVWDGGGTALWGRRSIFRLLGRPLLVSEFFLPAFESFLEVRAP